MEHKLGARNDAGATCAVALTLCLKWFETRYQDAKLNVKMPGGEVRTYNLLETCKKAIAKYNEQGKESPANN